MAWIFEHLEDIRSDLSVFHRVDDLESMRVDRFLSFAFRLPHYQGAMRNFVLRELADNEPAAAEPASVAAPTGGNDDFVATSVDMLAAHPVWGSIGAYSKAPLAAEN